MTAKDLEQKQDGELIAMYVEHRACGDSVMRVLVERYQGRMYTRFLSRVSDETIASDLLQELWVKVTRSLERYKDEGKFEHYLSKLATNLLTDFYRRQRVEKEAVTSSRYDGRPGSNSADYDRRFEVDSYADPSQNVEQENITDALMQYLIEVLVPGLPVEQRTAWLLRHESEYWQPGLPLEWGHLAQLSGLAEAEAAEIFYSARRKLMTHCMADELQTGCPLEDIELLVFLVWTQAQRLDKSQKFTWDDIAELLGQPATTMRTRYRAAQKALSEGITAYSQG